MLLRKKQLLLRILLLLLLWRKAAEPSLPRWWVREEWLYRGTEGAYNTMVRRMQSSDSELHYTFLRMSPSRFGHLLGLLKERLTKNPWGRPAIPPEQRLAITLRYLATGDSLKSLAFLFRVGFTTARRVVLETCEAIWEVLQPVYLPEPTRMTWERSTEGFAARWQFPNCVGAVDGKHVNIQAPPLSGSMYYNYKHHFSVNLMAIGDASYRFLAVSIGDYGSHSDGGVFKNCPIGLALEAGEFDLPPPRMLPGSTIRVPSVLVGDEAFQLRPDFMRPYPAGCLDRSRRIFNYRLSRARRCIENSFGILASRWRIFRRPLCLYPENVTRVVQACVVLHNYLLTEEDPTDPSSYCPPGHTFCRA
ncbi:uncharacterized protein LOC135389490 [Ornithodoros turicata]|uniref:uncharacterized protein LOC135389490 n=1 Tax=Ornithodoros turicata TaxID=34597 RepID=UPI003138C3B5